MNYVWNFEFHVKLLRKVFWGSQNLQHRQVRWTFPVKPIHMSFQDMINEGFCAIIPYTVLSVFFRSSVVENLELSSLDVKKSANQKSLHLEVRISQVWSSERWAQSLKRLASSQFKRLRNDLLENFCECFWFLMHWISQVIFVILRL